MKSSLFIDMVWERVKGNHGLEGQFVGVPVIVGRVGFDDSLGPVLRYSVVFLYSVHTFIVYHERQTVTKKKKNNEALPCVR